MSPAVRQLVNQPLQSRLREMGRTTVRLTEIASLLRQAESTELGYESFIHGRTPMHEVMTTIADRFDTDAARRTTCVRRMLFVVSDGEPTDANPTQLFAKMKADGITIFSCYLTSSDVSAPRTLPASSNPSWPDGARLMFEAASQIDDRNPRVQTLRRRGWTIPDGARYFAQINHSQILADLVRVFLGRGEL